MSTRHRSSAAAIDAAFSMSGSKLAGLPELVHSGSADSKRQRTLFVTTIVTSLGDTRNGELCPTPSANRRESLGRWPTTTTRCPAEANLRQVDCFCSDDILGRRSAPCCSSSLSALI